MNFSWEDNSQWLSESEVQAAMSRYSPMLERVKRGDPEYAQSLGWLDVATWAGEPWLSRYETLARQVQQNADVLVVVGIGGSNQAARAVIDALGKKNHIQVLWAGNSISAHSINQVLEQLRGRRVYINVIAKNFETLEPGIGFRALRDYLRDCCGETYASHVICTGTAGSHLEELCKKHGYEFLPFPKEIGGRFTALSPVGLFPLCVAGMDIRAMAQGACEMRQRLLDQPADENVALRYASIRNLLYQKGFRMEMLAFFEPRLFRFAKWWMQLFGESEGKDGKGLYPLFGNFSEDLHSVGQFIQEGSNIIFETFLEVRDSGSSYVLHNDDVDDHFGYLDGMDFAAINQAAYEATVEAHSRRFPCIRLTVDTLDERTFGQLYYFFQFACYLSAIILGVNPFDQPGVEAYKTNMFRALGK